MANEDWYKNCIQECLENNAIERQNLIKESEDLIEHSKLLINIASQHQLTLLTYITSKDDKIDEEELEKRTEESVSFLKKSKQVMEEYLIVKKKYQTVCFADENKKKRNKMKEEADLLRKTAQELEHFCNHSKKFKKENFILNNNNNISSESENHHPPLEKFHEILTILEKVYPILSLDSIQILEQLLTIKQMIDKLYEFATNIDQQLHLLTRYFNFF